MNIALDIALFIKNYLEVQGEITDESGVQTTEQDFQLDAAWRCAGDAVELVCLIFRNTWAEILKIRNYMQILNPQCDFHIFAR